MKENLRQNWKEALVKFSVTKQEQTIREDDAIVPFVKNVVPRNEQDFIFVHQPLNLKKCDVLIEIKKNKLIIIILIKIINTINMNTLLH